MDTYAYLSFLEKRTYKKVTSEVKVRNILMNSPSNKCGLDPEDWSSPGSISFFADLCQWLFGYIDFKHVLGHPMSHYQCTSNTLVQ